MKRKRLFPILILLLAIILSATLAACKNPRVKAEFFVDGERIAVRKIERGSPLLDIPEIPRKENMIGEWDFDDFDAVQKSVKINAIYRYVTYRVVFVGEDGQSVGEIVLNNGTSLSESDIPETPPKKGYAAKWNVTDFSRIDKDITVRPIYTKNPCWTVKLFDRDGSFMRAENVEKDFSAEEFSPEPREGYDFEGWYEDIDYRGEKIVFPYKFTGDIKLYAKWGKRLSAEETGNFSVDSGVITRYRGTSEKVFLPPGAAVIGESAFENNAAIRTLVLNPDVTEIGNSAFSGCENLETVEFSDGKNLVAKIGQNAFSGCKSLTEFAFSAYLKEIGFGAFDGCEQICEYTGSESAGELTEIKDYVFRNNNNLKKFVLPPNAAKVGARAFDSCSDLAEVTFGNLEIVGAFAFAGCSSLKTVDIPKVVKLGAGAFRNCEKLTRIDAPNIAETGDEAFAGCPKLSSVYIEAPTPFCAAFEKKFSSDTGPGNQYYKVETFSENAENAVFWLPKSLNKVTVNAVSGETPSTVVTVGAFKDCRYVRDVILSEGITGAAAGSFEISDADKVSAGEVFSVSFPSTLKDIGGNAFRNRADLKKIGFPKGLKTIGENAFSGCVCLGDVLLPDAATLDFIGEGAFDDTEWFKTRSGLIALGGICIGLGASGSDANFGVGEFRRLKVRVVNPFAFKKCSALRSVELPADIEIGEGAFEDCVNLENLVLSENAAVGANILRGCVKLVSLTVSYGDDLASFFGESGYPPEFGKLTLLADKKKILAAGACSGMGSLKEVALAEGFASVEGGAFRDLPELDSVVFPASVTEIGTEAKDAGAPRSIFANCPEVKTVIFGDGASNPPSRLRNIRAGAFEGSKEIESVRLPASVESVGEKAFYGMENLREVEFVSGGAAPLDVGKNAFGLSGSPAVENISVILPDRLVSLGERVFSGRTNLKKIVLPESLTNVGPYVFENCGLTELAVPAGVKFYDASVPGGCLAGGMLSGNADLRILTIRGAVAIKDLFAPENQADFSASDIPVKFASVAGGEIAEGQFEGMTQLTDVGIAAVTKIGGNAFSGCTGLTKAVIPETVAEIGVAAFERCENLSVVAFGGSSGLRLLGNRAFRGCARLKEIALPDSVTSDGGDYGWNGIFDGCENLVKANVPSGVTSIGERAFAGDVLLRAVKFPSGLTSIGESAFENCASAVFSNTKLKNLTKTDRAAFSGCAALETFDAENLSFLGDNAFFGCENLAAVGLPSEFISDVDPGSNRKLRRLTCYGSAVPDFSRFRELPELKEIKIDGATVENLADFAPPEGVKILIPPAVYDCLSDEDKSKYVRYPSALPEAVYDFGDDMTATLVYAGPFDGEILYFPSEIEYDGNTYVLTGIGKTEETRESAFRDARVLKEVVFDADSRLEKIGASAFKGRDELSCVNLPDGLKTIGAEAFAGCGLERAVIPGSVENIGDGAFGNCAGLEELIFRPGDRPLYIGEKCFSGCRSLKTVEIPENAASAGAGVLAACDSLEKISVAAGNSDYYAVDGCLMHTATKTLVSGCKNGIIPEIVVSVGAFAFFGIPVENAKLPKGLVSIGESAFEKSSVKNILFATDGKLRKIGVNAFAYCPIGEISIPSNVEQISGGAFKNCSSLRGVEFGAESGLKVIGDGAFENCEALRAVEIPSSVVSIGASAFANCAVDKVSIPSGVSNIGAGAFPNGAVLYAEAESSPDGWAVKKEGSKIYLSGASDTAEGSRIYFFSESRPGKDGDFWHYADDGKALVWKWRFEFAFGNEAYSVSGRLPADSSGIEDDTFAEIPENADDGTHGIAPVKAIGADGFWNLPIVGINIAETVESIGSGAFSGCNFDKIVIPAGVTSVGAGAFPAQTVVYSEAETERADWRIENGIFYYSGIQPLESGEYWHYVDDGIEVWEFEDSWITEEDDLRFLYNGSDGYLLGYVTTYAGDAALTLPDGFTAFGNRKITRYEIYPGAFENKAVLQSVTIPVSVTRIRENAFYGCAALETVIFDADGSVAGIGAGAFGDCAKLKEIILPAAAEEVDKGAFKNCSSLRRVKFGAESGLKVIGDGAFENCRALGAVEIPSSVVSIGASAFANCAVDKVSIPSGVSNIGAGAFPNGAVLYAEAESSPEGWAVKKEGSKIYLSGASDTAEGSRIYFFSESRPNVKGSYWHYVGDDIGAWEFIFKYETTPEGDAYTLTGFDKTADNIRDDVSITVPDDYLDMPVVGISAGAFEGLPFVRVEIGKNTVAIGKEAFRNCNRLAEIFFAPDGNLESVGEHAFLGCASLEVIEFPASASPNGITVGGGAFAGCPLKHIIISESVASIAESAFEDCRLVESVTVAEGNTHYRGDGGKNYLVAKGVEKLILKNASSTVLPNDIAVIGAHVFRGSGIKRIFIYNSVAEIEEGAFLDCVNLSEVAFEVGSRLENIAKNAFAGCPLSDVTVPRTVVKISAGAFPAQTVVYSEAETERADWQIENEIFYYSEIQPFEQGDFWYYGDDRKTRKIWKYMFSFKQNADGSSYSVTKIELMNRYSVDELDIIVPETYNGLEVTAVAPNAFKNSQIVNIAFPVNLTEIGESAFENCRALKRVSFPESDGRLSVIGDAAFKNCPFESIAVPDAVSEIGAGAFSGCSALSAVNFKSSGKLGRIGENAFSGCPLTSLKIPGSVKILDNGAFENCDKLTEIIFSDEGDLTVIGERAFAGCSNLNEPIIPKSVEKIWAGAFAGCPSLSAIFFELGSNLVEIGAGAFVGCPLETAELPDKVKTIRERAFAGCPLSSFKIPSGVNTIGEEAFAGCPLRTIEIPDKTISIGAGAFTRCTALEMLKVTAGNTKYESIEDACLVEKSGNKLMACCNKAALTIPSTVAVIGRGAFAGAGELLSVKIPDRVEKIEENAFEDCSKMRLIEFGQDSSLVEIGPDAFKNCSSLEGIEIPSRVTSIAGGAFAGCSSLRDIAVGGFNKCYRHDGGCLIESGTNTLIAAGKDVTAIPSGVVKIGVRAFSGRSIGSMTIPASVEYIEEEAFAGCENLTSVSFDSAKMKEIGEGAFSGCGLISLTIPKSVRKIGERAFENCASIESVTFTPGCKISKIEARVFANCGSLEKITVPVSVAEIGAEAFRKCGLKEVVFSEGSKLSKIGEAAFANCVSLGRILSVSDGQTVDGLPENVTVAPSAFDKDYAFPAAA